MSRWTGVVFVLVVVFLAMGFAAANGGNRATLSLGLFTLYRIPVTLVAFSGLLVGMLVMFATGIHSDLKVRKILRDRLAEETREEQSWIDRNQRDLFAPDPEAPPGAGPESRLAGGEGQNTEPGSVPLTETPRHLASPTLLPLVSEVDAEVDPQERDDPDELRAEDAEGEPTTR